MKYFHTPKSMVAIEETSTPKTIEETSTPEAIEETGTPEAIEETMWNDWMPFAITWSDLNPFAIEETRTPNVAIEETTWNDWLNPFAIKQEPPCEMLYQVPSHQLTPSRLYQHINTLYQHINTWLHHDLGNTDREDADRAEIGSADGADPQVVVVWGGVHFLGMTILVTFGFSWGWRWCKR